MVDGRETLPTGLGDADFASSLSAWGAREGTFVDAAAFGGTGEGMRRAGFGDLGGGFGEGLGRRGSRNGSAL